MPSRAGHRWSALRSAVSAVNFLKRPPRCEWRALAAVHSDSQLMLSAHRNFSDSEKEEEHDVEAHRVPATTRRSTQELVFGHVAVRSGLLVLFVVITANDVLFKSYSQRLSKDTGKEPFSAFCFMLITNATSVCVGNIIHVCFAIRSKTSVLGALKECWCFRRIVSLGLPSAFFMLSTIFKFIALRFISPSAVVAFDQSQLLLCALVGSTLLGKSYSFPQWSCFFSATLCIGWFDQAKLHHATKFAAAAVLTSGRDRALGLAFMGGSVVFACLGGLSCEVLLKKEPSIPFYVSKAHMEVGGTISALMACVVLEPAMCGSCSLLDRGLFGGWDGWTRVVFATTFGKSWLAGIVVQVLDNLILALAGTVSMLLVYLEQLGLLGTSLHEPFDLHVFLSVLSLAASLAAYTMASQRPVNITRARVSPLQEPLIRKRH